MGGELVTLLWVVDGAPHGGALVRDAAHAATRVVEAREADLEVVITKARAQGAVVALGDTDKLPALLKLGADEVASWSTAPEKLSETIGRARARADWRATNRDIESSELAGLAFMSAAIGHEIRNPLAAAMINCTTIAHLVGPIPAESDLHGALSDINEALRSIANVVSQMVSLTDPGEVGVCDMSRTLVELTTYVHKEVELSADFVTEIPDVPCAVAMSRTRAVEVVAALLNNAVHACERAAPRPCHIDLRLTMEAEMIVVELTDDGEGMTSDVRQRALQPFFTTRRPGRLGMGLAFAAMHVRRANGEILIDSEPGEGTSVRVFLPRIAAPDSSPRIKN
ncbi:MAG TPA: HAMP domain-containing sensor histidine kinase [Polyangiaceae bacterium]|jgi:signal transduction histidine kinase|nr:HAMP domain-containing sensor histidine kinase [Polyangiaceae bacterium]